MAGLRCRGEFGGGEPLPDSFKPTIRVPLRGRVPSAFAKGRQGAPLKPLLDFIRNSTLAVFVQLIYVIFNTSFEQALSLPLYALTAKK